MTEPILPVVTAEARALLAELGFIEVIEGNGRVLFIERNEYEKLLAAGKLVDVRAAS